jgi:hypothetical protein
VGGKETRNVHIKRHTQINKQEREMQGDKSLCAPDDYSTKTRKNILNSFNHLP